MYERGVCLCEILVGAERGKDLVALHWQWATADKERGRLPTPA